MSIVHRPHAAGRRLRRSWHLLIFFLELLLLGAGLPRVTGSLLQLKPFGYIQTGEDIYLGVLRMFDGQTHGGGVVSGSTGRHTAVGQTRRRTDSRSRNR